MTTKQLEVYSSGVVHCSVCTTKELSVKDVERRANVTNPTGIDHQWKVTEKSFGDGKSNPCQCNEDPTRLHYLLTCWPRMSCCVALLRTIVAL